MRRTLFLLLFTLFLGGCRNPQSGTSATAAGLPNGSGTRVRNLEGPISGMYQDLNGEYWFFHREKGVYRYSGAHLILYTAEDGLCSTRILGIQEGAQGELYFDTPEGVCRFNGHTFSKLPLAGADHPDGGWRLQPGDLWFRMGWDHPGPFRFDGEFLHPLSLPKNAQEAHFRKAFPNASHNPYGLFSLYRDPTGPLWFGTADLGLYQYDGQTLRWIYDKPLTETPGGGAFGIRSIARDQQGRYWVNTARTAFRASQNPAKGPGLQPLGLQQQAGFNTEEDLYFLDILPTPDGELWMLTFDQGLWRSSGDRLVRFMPGKAGSALKPVFIYQDREGVLWIGTEKNGIYTYNGQALLPAVISVPG
ncbi:two-component regulator propeller domain-containing protein [Robiginitalea sp. M366]|uniref:ligand-binding sensor domain-containing protein n=1 Tax=Robiginitalea aestuariiviva TaxID=3036903 RepID=UPI00240E3E36|nr:two-component regulator propeller domain-containing protein [Robiginitalea aestuariiviva]MDG1572471.1 two-component regulator propeller domain-containing protein [Robiginitalea aestuariiviva]